MFKYHPAPNKLQGGFSPINPSDSIKWTKMINAANFAVFASNPNVYKAVPLASSLQIVAGTIYRITLAVELYPNTYAQIQYYEIFEDLSGNYQIRNFRNISENFNLL